MCAGYCTGTLPLDGVAIIPYNVNVIKVTQWTHLKGLKCSMTG